MEREKADEEPAPRARMARAFGVAIMVYLQEFKTGKTNDVPSVRS